MIKQMSGIRVIDSHTEGEPTRVIIAGGPDLGDGSLQQRLQRFRATADHVRRKVILEPRGSDVLVGALLCEPVDSTCAAGTIFFNNTGYLGMCGHGAMGVAVTLYHLGRIGLGRHRLETPVGVVEIELAGPNHVSITNVPSYRYRRKVSVEVEGFGTVMGDIAWGGNWFFLVDQSPLALMPENIPVLIDAAMQTRRSLRTQGITGAKGAEIDHIEFFASVDASDADSRNFVLCPGGAYDRSPCGTGTSAKLACLAADGRLRPGESWVQESVLGSRFIGCYQLGERNHVVPTISGHAYICSEATLFEQADDPFRHGIPTPGTL